MDGDVTVIEAELAAEHRHLDRLLDATMHRPDDAIAACERNIVRLRQLLDETLAKVASTRGEAA